MKHGVTYLNHSQYQRYKQRRENFSKNQKTKLRLLNAFKKFVVWMLITILGGLSIAILSSLFIRGLDIEYNMQQASFERFMIANGDSHDIQK